MFGLINKYFSKVDDAELKPIRKDLLQLILTTASALGGVALVTYAAVAYRLNGLSDLIPHALAYLLIVFVTFNIKLSYRSRVFAIMLAVYILAVAEFLNNGLNGDGRILMLTFVALTFYFSGIRWGFIAFLLSLVTQFFLSFAIPLNWIVRPVLNELDLSTNIAAWQVSTLMFVIIAAVMVGSGYLIISRLAGSLARQRSLTDELNQERDGLQIRVDVQTADLRREIAERMRIEGDLRASENQFRMLFESSLVPILLLRNDKFELVNQAYLKQIGSQILGRSFLEFTAPESRDALLKIFPTFLAGQTPPEIYETVGVRMDGTTFPCEVFATQLHLPGEPTTLVYLSDITDRKLSAEKLHFLSTHDSLTGLYNRAYFDHMLDLEADQIEVPVSILILDVNGLKKVNDTSGHGAGDALLQDTANVLLRAMRGEDTVARIGGDEFVVVMPATDREAAQKVVDRIQASIRTFNENHAHRHPISIAIGCATLGVNETWVNAVKRADEAMYIHKREKVTPALEGRGPEGG